MNHYRLDITERELEVVRRALEAYEGGAARSYRLGFTRSQVTEWPTFTERETASDLIVRLMGAPRVEVA